MKFETFPIRKGCYLVVQDQYPKCLLNADGSRLTLEALAEVVQAWFFLVF